MKRFDTVQLRRVADVRASNVDKKSAEGEMAVRLVNYTDVYYQDEVGATTPGLMDATATSAQIARFHLRVGDTVITKDSETAEDIGAPTYIADSAPDLICGYHLAIIRPGTQLNGRYLNYVMRSRFVRGQLTSRANGVTRYGLTYDAIKGVDIPFPDLNQQEQIALALDARLAIIRQMMPARTGVDRTIRGALDRLGTLLMDFEDSLISNVVLGDYELLSDVNVKASP